MEKPAEPCDIVPVCPICRVGAMTLAHKMKGGLHICVCMNCDTTLSVTSESLERFQRVADNAVG